MKNIQLRRHKDFYGGLFVGDFKDRLSTEVTRILALKDSEGNPPTIELRVEIINAIIDAYVEQTGQQPDGVQVQLLGNWLLFEELTDGHPDKVTREEYPFMTKRQLRTRYNRERADENISETLTQQTYLGGKKQSTYNKAE